MRPDFALDVVQIDHTLVDVMVVDHEHWRSIGRRWLTLAVDVASRAVVGFSVRKCEKIASQRLPRLRRLLLRKWRGNPLARLGTLATLSRQGGEGCPFGKLRALSEVEACPNFMFRSGRSPLPTVRKACGPAKRDGST